VEDEGIMLEEFVYGVNDAASESEPFEGFGASTEEQPA
jgi:hypothetical protein